MKIAGVDLCKYRELFGVPGRGIHKYRFMGVAIVDVIQSLIGAFILSWLTKWPFLYCAIGVFAAGILAHRAFCVRTTVDKLLFGGGGGEGAGGDDRRRG